MEVVVQIVFGIIALFILVAAVMVVSVRNVIHSALWLIACFFGVGALYMLLQAEFLAVVQVLVYVGAVSVLILFAIMLTRQISGEGVRQLTTRWPIVLAISVLLFATVMAPTLINQQWNVPPAPPLGTPEPIAGPAELGRGFVNEFLLQFQVVGVLLTVALIGAIVIAFEERARRRRVLTLAEELELKRLRAGATQPPLPEPVEAEPVARETRPANEV
ncbi:MULTISPECIES: NADH-quinone oxidoreductase subunit J family protein [Chloroflexus]|uniref:NADH-quinone oxidoreductase subunit J n=1 Tax=Chloroflexus aggregans (strain MD-66 / DSM 9485) TaxID=326427 RepID=B8GA11_CHLAD|nr:MULTISPECIES: NADH-quinone oxidoreductase subunit J [Chloroflexus]ACL24526.1 NADH-ubiquinone/plastoquinone oxidoreductase chain 6 [Chloroflexus aggregans DSM 9485]GIV90843.1 MAG: NADH-quinone oxidoreductase subunit J [Chloroflexus sp.]